MRTAEARRPPNVFREDWLWFATRRRVDTVAELARRGFAVTGVDTSGPSLELARAAAVEAGVEVDLRSMDMRDLEFAGEFDAAIDLFPSVGYGTEREDEAALLEDRRLDARSGRIASRWSFVLPGGERRRQEFSHRLYTRSELSELTRRAGLEVERAYGDLAGGDWPADSSRNVIVARRPA